MKYKLLFISLFAAINLQAETYFKYNIEIGAQAGSGSYAPLWFSANRYGLVSNESNSTYLQAGFIYHKKFNHNWNLNAGLDLTGGINQTSTFYLHQFYVDFCWKASI